MNFRKLAQEILSAEEINCINDSWKLLETEDYQTFYNINKHILEDMLSVSSYLDFLDYIDFLEVEKLNKTIFMCAWMEKNNKCIEIGGYEGNLQNKIVPFLTQKLDSVRFLEKITTDEIFSDYDGKDNLKDYIRKINAYLAPHDMQLILFFNDVYVQCTYNLFLFESKMAIKIIKEWDDTDIEAVLI